MRTITTRGPVEDEFNSVNTLVRSSSTPVDVHVPPPSGSIASMAARIEVRFWDCVNRYSTREELANCTIAMRNSTPEPSPSPTTSDRVASAVAMRRKNSRVELNPLPRVVVEDSTESDVSTRTATLMEPLHVVCGMDAAGQGAVGAVVWQKDGQWPGHWWPS